MSSTEPFVTLQNGFAAVTLPAKLYSLECIFGAAFIYLDRAYIRLEEGAKKGVQVLIKGRDQLDDAGLEALCGEFLNELVNQSIRQEISKSNNKLREYIVAKALFSAEDSQEDDFLDLLGGDDDAEMLDDPLGIATPWEEKYGQNKPGGV